MHLFKAEDGSLALFDILTRNGSIGHQAITLNTAEIIKVTPDELQMVIMANFDHLRDFMSTGMKAGKYLSRYGLQQNQCPWGCCSSQSPVQRW